MQLIKRATNVEGIVNKPPPRQQTNLSDRGQAKAELRRARLAAALRKNLKRRKMQQGGRETLPEPDEMEAASDEGD